MGSNEDTGLLMVEESKQRKKARARSDERMKAVIE